MLCNDLISVVNLMDIYEKYRNSLFHSVLRTGSDDLATGIEDFWGRLSSLSNKNSLKRGKLKRFSAPPCGDLCLYEV